MGRPYTSSEQAWEDSQQGLELYRKYTKDANAEARKLFEKAIATDPKFARAYAYLAATHRQDGNMEWTPNRVASEGSAYLAAQKAVELARAELEPKPSLPYVLYHWGFVLLYSGQHEPARAAAAEAVQRDPNYADAYALWAHILMYMGKPWDALPKLLQAIQRNPKDPFLYNYYRGALEYVWSVRGDRRDREQHLSEAEKHLWAAVNGNGSFRPARAYLAAVLEARGKHNDAKNEMDTLAKGGRPRPSQNLPSFKAYIEQSLPYADPAIRDGLIELWRKADQ